MKTLLVLIVLALVATGAFLYFNDDVPVQDDGIVACTLEAKLCPDGSYVGRGGPNCEFAPCPNSDTSPSPTPTQTPAPTPIPAPSPTSLPGY